MSELTGGEAKAYLKKEVRFAIEKAIIDAQNVFKSVVENEVVPEFGLMVFVEITGDIVADALKDYYRDFN